jgi:hypothetical protein
VQKGPESTRVRSRTLTPVSGMSIPRRLNAIVAWAARRNQIQASSERDLRGRRAPGAKEVAAI